MRERDSRTRTQMRAVHVPRPPGPACLSGDNGTVPPPPVKAPRGDTRVVRVGAPRPLFGDVYHAWLTAPWSVVVAAIVVLYLAANAAFAGAYLALGGLEGARPGSFEDAFFFSVQTLSTIGYGRMTPVGTAANALVAVEALSGLLGFSMVTGLLFAQFARPTARVLFSRVAVVTQREGQPSLMFRMANERGNQIVDAHVRVVLARNERTAEGEEIRRFHELPLVRGWAAFFALTWTAIHPIGPDSPLHGVSAETAKDAFVDIIVLVTGTDETFSQAVHARHAYGPRDIVWNGRFVDVMSQLPDGRFQIDYRRFHDAEPAVPAGRGSAG